MGRGFHSDCFAVKRENELLTVSCRNDNKQVFLRAVHRLVGGTFLLPRLMISLLDGPPSFRDNRIFCFLLDP
jgi:hypothetical protein